jgi:hypothetical protein
MQIDITRVVVDGLARESTPKNHAGLLRVGPTPTRATSWPAS